jgi:hypothetical protein
MSISSWLSAGRSAPSTSSHRARSREQEAEIPVNAARRMVEEFHTGAGRERPDWLD